MDNNSLNYSCIYKDIIEGLGEKVTLEVYKDYGMN